MSLTPDNFPTGLLIAEVVKAYPPSDDFNYNKTRWEYTVRAITQNSSVSMYNHAILLEQYSGFDDYSERVIRSTFATDPKAFSYSLDSRVMSLKAGDKCVIAFIGENSRKPVILGFIPANTSLPEENTDKDLNKVKLSEAGSKPQLRGRYNGVNYHIDGEGQFRLQHTGIPTYTYESGLHKSTTPADITGVTTLDFLTSGHVRLVDSKEQAFVLNQTEGFISINNTTTPPPQKGGPEDYTDIEVKELGGDKEVPLGQEIRLDKTNQALNLLSSQTINLVAGTNKTVKVFGDSLVEILKNETRKISENFKETIGKSSTIDIGKNLAITAKDDITVTSKVGHSITMSAAKEVVTVKHKSGSQIELQKNGSIKATASDGSFITLDATTGNIKIHSQADVVVEAVNVAVNSGTVTLGTAAVQAAMLGDLTLAWLNSHTHSSNTGITGPVVIPAPATLLSTTVKVKS